MKIQDISAKQKQAWAEEPKRAFKEALEDFNDEWKTREFLLKKQAKDYASNSTIHGLYYIAEHGRPISEKICWVLATVGGFTLCALLIAPIFTKWRVSPTYTSINTTNYPVWNLPFPGVTICSNILVHNFHFSYELINSEEWRAVMEEEDLELGELFYMVEESISALISLQTKRMGDRSLGFNETDIRNFTDKYHGNLTSMMRKVGHSCGYMLIACYWQGEKVDCNEIFETSRTDVGFCCSFNTVKLAEEYNVDFVEKDISMSYYEDVDRADGTGKEYDPFDGYVDYWYYEYDYFNILDQDKRKKRSVSEETKPKESLRIARSNSDSSSLGLSVLLDVDQDYYYREHFTMNDYHGFKVLVHSPYDYPEVGSKGFTIGGGQVAYIGVDARRTSSTENVKSMSIKRRNCIKHDERMEDMEEAGVKMEVFANYSRPACLIECRAREMFKKCNCLPYYYPQFSTFWGVDTSCDSEGIECVFSKSDILKALDTGEENDLFAAGASCYCPIDCEENVYIPEMSQAKIRSDSYVLKDKQELDLDIALGERFIEFYTPLSEKLNKSVETMEECVENNVPNCNNTHFNGNQTLNENSTMRDLNRMLFAERKRKEFVDDRLEYWIQKNITFHAETDVGTALIHVYFKQLGIIEYIRDELYSGIDFLAAVGGLIGLCTGFSIISMVELLYWFTNRMWNDELGKKKGTQKRIY